MTPQGPIHLLFAATSDYLPYAIVTARSVAENANGRPIAVHFLYADIVKPISDEQRRLCFEIAQHSFDGLDVTLHLYDITDKIPLLDGQNIGVWGHEISMTHYMYLLAPLVLPDTLDQVIYLDTDMIANADLSSVYDIDMDDNLISMTVPSGLSIYPDMSNTGFVMLNLKQWRDENTLESLLKFGRQLPRCHLCDQHLMYQYFTKSNPTRVKLVDTAYNAQPHRNNDKSISELKIIHYCGGGLPKPWTVKPCTIRCFDIWWKYARLTPFYEMFLMDMVKNALPTPVKKHHSFWWHLRHLKF